MSTVPGTGTGYPINLGQQSGILVHVYWGASGLPTIGTHKLLHTPPRVPTSHPAHNITSLLLLILVAIVLSIFKVERALQSPHDNSAMTQNMERQGLAVLELNNEGYWSSISMSTLFAAKTQPSSDSGSSTTRAAHEKTTDVMERLDLLDLLNLKLPDTRPPVRAASAMHCMMTGRPQSLDGMAPICGGPPVPLYIKPWSTVKIKDAKHCT